MTHQYRFVIDELTPPKDLAGDSCTGTTNKQPLKVDLTSGSPSVPSTEDTKQMCPAFRLTMASYTALMACTEPI